jgi:hypothetical protein
MGAGHSICCNTCKKDYYLGYGSYTNCERRIEKFPANEHEGHDFFHYTEDYTFVDENGNLVFDTDYTEQRKVLAAGFKDYESIDLDDS